MALCSTDEIKISPEAIEFIESKELGCSLAKYEIIEYFFDWLKNQPRITQAEFLKEALSE